MSSARVIGAFANASNKSITLRGAVDGSQGLIMKQLEKSLFKGKAETHRNLFDIPGYKEDIVCVVGLGEKSEESPGNVRLAGSTAVKAISSLDSKSSHSVLFTDDLATENGTFIKALAEGVTLSTYSFDTYKETKKRTGPISVHNLHSSYEANAATKQEWRDGEILGQAQNIARNLMDTPANLLTPKIFTERAQEMFLNSEYTEVIVQDRSWAEEKAMGAFVSVSNGGKNGQGEELKFLEIHYKGDPSTEGYAVGLVGKGVTFDSGGISLKGSNNMAQMKADMGGAAVVLSALWGIEQLKLKMNVIVCIPLTENMPSGTATKPGDIVWASNGLTIEVDDTDAEGRLILADALHYISSFKPNKLVELSTLTGAIDVALGEGYAGVFTKDDKLWKSLESAGAKRGDEFWRMPLDDRYASQIKSSVADLKNVGGRGAGACTAALFLQSFVPKDIPFAHCDIAGTMNSKGSGLLSAGMTGRPTRSIIQLAQDSQNKLN